MVAFRFPYGRVFTAGGGISLPPLCKGRWQARNEPDGRVVMPAWYQIKNAARGARLWRAPPRKKQNKKRAAISSLRLTAGGLFLPAPHGSLPRLADRGQCSSFCGNFVLATDGRQPLCPLPMGAPSSGRMRSLQAYIAYHAGERAVKRFRGILPPFGGLSGCP